MHVDSNRTSILSQLGTDGYLADAVEGINDQLGETQFAARMVFVRTAYGTSPDPVINLQQTRLTESEEDQAKHGRLLYKALSSGEGMLVPAHSGTGDNEEQVGNPTEFLLVIGPLKTRIRNSPSTL